MCKCSNIEAFCFLVKSVCKLHFVQHNIYHNPALPHYREATVYVSVAYKTPPPNSNSCWLSSPWHWMPWCIRTVAASSSEDLGPCRGHLQSLISGHLPTKPHDAQPAALCAGAHFCPWSWDAALEEKTRCVLEDSTAIMSASYCTCWSPLRTLSLQLPWKTLLSLLFFYVKNSRHHLQQACYGITRGVFSVGLGTLVCLSQCPLLAHNHG